MLTSNLMRTQQRQNIRAPFDGSLRLGKTPVAASFHSNLGPNGVRSNLEGQARLGNFSNAATAFVTPSERRAVP